MAKDRSAAGQAGYQLAALGVTIAMAIVGGAVTGKSLGVIGYLGAGILSR